MSNNFQEKESIISQTVKQMVFLLLLSASFLVFTGCASTDAPTEVYYNMSNWYVRQNATPKYAVPFDIFYVYPKAFQGQQVDPLDIERTEAHTVEKFGKGARVFAPVCRNAKECEAAFMWYLENYHGDKGRPFVFIGEQDGAKMLEPLVKDAQKYGLIYTVLRQEESEEELLTPEVVDEVLKAVRTYLFERGWKIQESYE